MSKHHDLRIAVALTLAFVSVGISARAEETVNVRHDSGEITWVDLKQGKLELKSDASPITGEVQEYRITQNETRVTDPKDEKMMTVNDLWPGQRVTIDVVDGKEDKIVEKVTVIPVPGSDLYEAYGRVESIDAAGTLVLAVRSKLGDAEYTDQANFVFDPNTVIVMESPSQVPVQLQVKPGNIVKVVFVARNGKKTAQSVTLYSAKVTRVVTTTTVTTTQ